MHAAVPFRFRTSCLAKRNNDAVVFEHCFRFHPSHGWLVGARTFVHIVPFLRFLLRRSRDFDLLIAALLDRCASALDLAASLVCVGLVVALTIIEAKRKVSSRCVKCVSVGVSVLCDDCYRDYFFGCFACFSTRVVHVLRFSLRRL
jgi:hypothetical protein